MTDVLSVYKEMINQGIQHAHVGMMIMDHILNLDKLKQTYQRDKAKEDLQDYLDTVINPEVDRQLAECDKLIESGG